MAKFGEWTVIKKGLKNTLPEVDEKEQFVVVIASTKDSSFPAVFNKVYGEKQNVWTNIWNDKPIKSPKIIAWMPLPEPYKKQ